MQSGTGTGTGNEAGDSRGTVANSEEQQLPSSSAANVNTSRTSDHGKRRKSKSRSATVPINSNYPKDHFDAWLENCLKDAPNQQVLSSSSEFLDYNPTSFNSTRRSSQKHDQSQPSPQTQYQHQKQFKPPFSQGFQKTVPYMIRSPYGNSQNLMHNDESVEFASLPPIVNMMASENEHNSTVGVDGSSNPANNRGFRFSDPCLINPSDNDSKISGQNTPDRRNFNNGSLDGNNKFFAALMEQINLLHETNSKICRNLHETKVDIEALKHAPNWGLRNRRDSLSGLSTHSQPLGFAFGTHSPAPTYHSGAYTPGMMTDVVREVKEAARVREDALLNRVKSMVEERSWSMSEGNLRIMRDMEELKLHVQHLRADRKEANKRISQLEAENRHFRQLIGTLVNNRSPEIIHENEIFRSTPLRKNFVPSEIASQNRQRQNSFNLNYGTINQEDSLNTLHITERLDPVKNGSESKSTFPDGHGPPLNGMAMGQHYSASGNDRLEDDAYDNTMDLERDLRESVTARSQQESRIIALENMVRKLQVNNASGDERNNGMGNFSGGDGNYFNSSLSPSGGEFMQNTNLVNVSHNQQQQQLHPQQLQQLQQQHTQGHSPKFSLAGPITDL